MPATRSSSSSLSSFSIPSQWQSPELFKLSFTEFLEWFDTDETYDELMVTLFERHNFILKTNSIWHTARLVQCLQDEVDNQQKYMQSLFEEMEGSGLQQLLGQDFKWKKGEIRRQWGTRYTPQLDYPESVQIRPKTLILRRRSATPYFQPILSIPESIQIHSPTPSELHRQILLPFVVNGPISVLSTNSSYHTLALGTQENPIEILDDWRWNFKRSRGVMLRIFFTYVNYTFFISVYYLHAFTLRYF